MTAAPTAPLAVASEAPAKPMPEVEWSDGRLKFADAALDQRFIAEDRVLTLRNVRNLCWIAALLVPAAFVLDLFAYPALARDFAVMRLLCSLCLIGLLPATRTAWGQDWYRAFTVTVPMIPAFFISLMIKASHDPGSSYYAGLTLCLVAIGFMFHWTYRESALALALTIFFYLAANFGALLQGLPEDKLAAFANNCVFILLNGVVILSGSFFHHRIRVREFLNRVEIERQSDELKQRNEELTSTLKQLRETETQLVQSEKLASLGRMSAGIIHEINNPLNFTNQALFVLKKKAKHLPDTEREHFERIVTDIKEGLARVAGIVGDLRSFSHPDAGMCDTLDVTDTVSNALRFMSKEMKDHNIELATELQDGLKMTGDRNHLIQILINLMQNAVDAMKARGSGRITLSTAQRGDRVTISVQDNGCGIPVENQVRVFDPFFTTKAVGSGMGMGLSICYRLAQQMRGGIDLWSQPGTGTRFTLWVPASSAS